jgi:hypothetical protein
MWGKIKKIIWNIKALIIALIILIIVGWGLTIYFGIKANSGKGFCIDVQQKLLKLNYYSSLLNKSMQLIRKNKSLDALEDDVRLLDNGTLLTVWENVVFGGNREQDVNDYLDVIIDSLNFFSK